MWFWLALILMLVGIALSAFFSGSETGFYRVSRVRLLMDALEGDRSAKRLLFFSNHPPLFVATTLIGNNVANYLTSLAIVLGTKALVDAGPVLEMAASIFMSPVIFAYGELMPKMMFFQAPNYLLRRCGLFFSFWAILFVPISAILWSLGRLLEVILGQSPTKVRLALAKKELGQVLIEGQDAGILHPTQLNLAQNFILVATKEVSEATTPLTKLTTIPHSVDAATALKVARRFRLTEIAVKDKNTGEIAGYVRTHELLLDPNRPSISHNICPLVEINQSASYGEAIVRLQTARELMARVVNDQDETVGIVTRDELTAPLLSGPLLGLRR